jgi:hypothetical protein
MAYRLTQLAWFVEHSVIIVLALPLEMAPIPIRSCLFFLDSTSVVSVSI